MLRISRETGGKLACRRDWMLHPLVVRRAVVLRVLTGKGLECKFVFFLLL
jgi:hypothetical protein